MRNDIQTDRLILEPLELKHLSEAYVSWLNDPEVYKYLDTRGNQTIQSVESFIKNQQENDIKIWAIIVKENNQHIGNIKIDPINKTHNYGEYGILIGEKSAWGKGYAKEASLAVLSYFFNHDNYLRKINLGVVKNNESAVNLYTKIGFKQEGYLRKQAVYDGIEYDIIRMGILREDFLI